LAVHDFSPIIISAIRASKTKLSIACLNDVSETPSTITENARDDESERIQNSFVAYIE